MNSINHLLPDKLFFIVPVGNDSASDCKYLNGGHLCVLKCRCFSHEANVNIKIGPQSKCFILVVGQGVRSYSVAAAFHA